MFLMSLPWFPVQVSKHKFDLSSKRLEEGSVFTFYYSRSRYYCRRRRIGNIYSPCCDS